MKKKATRNPSRSEHRAYAALRSSINLSSHEVECRITTLRGVIADTEQDIRQLQAKLAQRRACLAEDSAIALGLEAVLEARR